MRDNPNRMSDAELLLELADVLADVLEMPNSLVESLGTCGLDIERVREIADEAKKRGLR